MAYFRDPMFAAEPYEDQGDELKSPASADALKAFYQDMERKETMERKLSKRKSNSGTSIWSRKSVKRSTAPPPPRPQPAPKQLSRQQPPLEASLQSKRDAEDELEMQKLEEQRENPDTLPALNSSRSIVPDPLNELPSWFSKDDWGSSTFRRTRFPMHNPVGPRYYRNYHLIPSSQLRPAARPPSVFSPSFPAMTANSQERLEDLSRIAGPSRTPSHSPLPTPNSSQTRVADANGKPRSRKTSQTAHDGVDLLDVTDPWGTNWHHQSPYDIGLNNNPVSPEVLEGINQTRSRHSSKEARSKTVTPSPLSQSTSAVHLQPPEPEVRSSRKLSKRRAPVLGSLFHPQAKEPERNAVSLPATPIDATETTSPGNSPEKPVQVSQIRRTSMNPASGPPISYNPSIITAKKEKRVSVLGRLAKKFSIGKKSPVEPEHRNSWQHVDGKRESVIAGRQLSPEKAHKRVPAPSIDATDADAPITVQLEPAATKQQSERGSTYSLDDPFSIGKLTIANPDTPGSETDTPVQSKIPLPPKTSEATLTAPKRRSEENTHAQSPEPISGLPPPSLEHVFSPRPSSSNYERALPSPAAAPTQDYLPPSSPAVTSPSSHHTRASEDSRSYVGPSSPITVSSSSHHIRAPEDSNPYVGSTSPVNVATSSHHTKAAEDSRPYIGSPSPLTSSTRQSKAREDSRSLQRHSDKAPPADKPSSSSEHSRRRSGDSRSKPSELSSSSQKKRTTDTQRRSRSPERKQVSQPAKSTSQRNVPAASAVPFPAAEPAPSHPVPSYLSELISVHSHDPADSSPLSAVSMLANPPTPYNPEIPMLPTGSETPPPPVPSKRTSFDNKRPSREPSPGVSSVTGRQTETFRLVRSSSGNIYASSETIRAAGEQWEVVEQVKRDRSAKSRDRESNGRREHKRQEEGGRHRADADAESEQRRVRSQTHRSHRHHSGDVAASPDKGNTLPRAASLETRDSSAPPSRADHPVNVNKPQPPPPPPTPGPSVRPLERNPSVSARPTSEVPSAADLNAMRAREAWEMERLWKARSMYGMEPNGHGIGPATMPVNGPPNATAMTDANMPGVHGSSHTSYMVQNSFQGQHPSSQIYHSMPASPPPIIYSSVPSLTQPQHHPSSAPNYPVYHSAPDVTSLQSSRVSLNNPLPEPPRESAFQPSPIARNLLDSSSTRSADYWTKYPGVTTAH